MTQTEKTTTASKLAAEGPKAAEAKPEVDPRIMELVVALVPAVGELVPTEEQKKVGEAIGKLVEDAQASAKKQAEKASASESAKS